MAAVYPSYNGYIQHDNTACHKAQVISICFHEFSVFQWSPQSTDLNPMGCGRMGDFQHENATDQSAVII